MSYYDEVDFALATLLSETDARPVDTGGSPAVNTHEEDPWKWTLPDGWTWFVVPASSGEGLEWSAMKDGTVGEWPIPVAALVLRRDREDPAVGTLCSCINTEGAPDWACLRCDGLGAVLDR
jgi:hypothetical protein